jgi:hypothetical protein
VEDDLVDYPGDLEPVRLAFPLREVIVEDAHGRVCEPKFRSPEQISTAVRTHNRSSPTESHTKRSKHSLDSLASYLWLRVLGLQLLRDLPWSLVLATRQREFSLSSMDSHLCFELNATVVSKDGTECYCLKQQ